MPGMTDTNAAPDVFGGWCVDRSRIDDVASINIRVVCGLLAVRLADGGDQLFDPSGLGHHPHHSRKPGSPVSRGTRSLRFRRRGILPLPAP